MVETMVVKETISSEMIHAGEELIRRLDRAGLPVSAALWLYLPESNTWRLIIASTDVRTQGPKRVYQKIQSIIIRMLTESTGLGLEGMNVELHNVSVVEDDDSLVGLFRKAVKTGPNDIRGIRFSKNTIDGHFIEDAYLYRLA